jgi:hypothetical protein
MQKHRENLDALSVVIINIRLVIDYGIVSNFYCIHLGLTYCTLNKIHRDDLLHVLQLYPDFAKSFTERFRVTFDLQQVIDIYFDR